MANCRLVNMMFPDRVWLQVSDRVLGQVLRVLIWNQVQRQVLDQVWDQMPRQVRNHMLRNHMRGV